MGVIDKDKYYTDTQLAKELINTTYRVIGLDNISEIIEPSAGAGAFSNEIPNCIAYDIEPEHKSIIKQDFLKLDLPYKKGRLLIGNPPFGSRNNLSFQFIKKAFEISDYVAFIQPISQLNNNIKVFKFDLIYSAEIKNNIYSEIKVLTCFNIYRRPKNGILNKKQNYNLKDIKIKRIDRSKVILDKNEKYDLIMCKFGSSTGKINKKIDTHCSELLITINNNLKNKKEILDYLNIFVNDLPKIRTISIAFIYKELKKKFPELSYL